jgi:hypothetical protein
MRGITYIKIILPLFMSLTHASNCPEEHKMAAFESESKKENVLAEGKLNNPKLGKCIRISKDVSFNAINAHEEAELQIH